MSNGKKGREPTRAQAYAVLAACACCIFAAVRLGAPVQAGVAGAAAVAALYAARLGYGWKDIEVAVGRRIGDLCGTMLIMWMIGFLLGSMLYSGLLPMLVRYGFDLVRPRWLYLGAMAACMVMSTATGSSWSAAGTAGVACIAIAHGHGWADMAVVAGAAVCGSVFGDKLSPVSETTNLAPACAGTDLYSHIRAQLWTTVPAVTVAAAVFLFLGVRDYEAGGAAAGTGTMLAIQGQLDMLYRWHWALLLPLALLLVLSIRRVPAVPSMAASSVLNLLLGRIVQGTPLGTGLSACVNGFRTSMIAPEGMEIHAKVAYVLDRGGMASMVSIILICFCGFSMTAVLDMSGVMHRAVEPLSKSVGSRWQAMLTAEIATLVMAMLAGISYMGSVFVGDAWGGIFDEHGMGRPCLSRTLEDVGTCCTAVIPWCSSAAFFSSTLDVPVWGAGGFAPFTFLPFLCPAIAFLLAVLGVGLCGEQKGA